MVHVPAVGVVETRDASSPHIIDTLIAERAPRLTGSTIWPLIRPGLYALLDYGKARRMAETICSLGGRAALEHVSDLLALKVEVSGLEHLPTSGRVVIVANHPTGIGDGVAVYDTIKARRPDVVFFANADAHRVCRRFDEVLIPVEWVEAKRTRESARRTLERTRAAMEAQACLVVFPSGRLARRQPGGRLADPPWASTPFAVARKHHAPILPIHVAGPWSRLFHLFHRVSGELRDITLFHELLNKQGQVFQLTIGAPIPPEVLAGDAAETAARLKAYVEETLPVDPDKPFA